MAGLGNPGLGDWVFRQFTGPRSFGYIKAVKTVSQDLLDEVTRRLAAEFKPEQVWLFGSHAWGNRMRGAIWTYWW